MKELAISRDVLHYSLDMIISVGYRVNSKQATNFRKWATKTLKLYISEGYVIDPVRIQSNYQNFLDAVEKLKVAAGSNDIVSQVDTMELVRAFASTWLSLDAYDKSELPAQGVSKQTVKITADELLGGE